MEFVSIGEFLQLSNIEQSDLVDLLTRGRLRFAPGDGGELLIDITSFDFSSLGHGAQSTETVHEDFILLEEEIASQILGIFEEVLDDAFALALSWLKSPENDQG